LAASALRSFLEGLEDRQHAILSDNMTTRMYFKYLPGEPQMLASVRLEVSSYETARMRIAFWHDLAKQLLNPAIALVAFIGFLLLGRAASAWNSLGTALLGTCTAVTVGYGVYWLTGRELDLAYAGWLPRGRLILVVVASAVLGVAWLREVGQGRGLQWFIASALAFGSIAIICLCLLNAIALWSEGVASSRLARFHPRAVILRPLVRAHALLSDRTGRNSLDTRAWVGQLLEHAAVGFSSDVRRFFQSREATTREWLDLRWAKAAEGLRQISRMVLVPHQSTWPRVDRLLYQEIRAIAAGDLANLIYWDTAPPQRRGWRVRLVSIVRPFAAILVPVPFVAAVQMLQLLEGQGLRYLELGAAIWIFLSALLFVDPRVAEKLALLRTVRELVRQDGPGSSEDRRAKDKPEPA
jgi:hypothetical protein